QALLCRIGLAGDGELAVTNSAKPFPPGSFESVPLAGAAGPRMSMLLRDGGRRWSQVGPCCLCEDQGEIRLIDFRRLHALVRANEIIWHRDHGRRVPLRSWANEALEHRDRVCKLIDSHLVEDLGVDCFG